jgi:hypothetical protein
MRWARHAARMEDEKCIQNLRRKSEGRDHTGDLGLDEKIILKLILKSYDNVELIHVAE